MLGFERAVQLNFGGYVGEIAIAITIFATPTTPLKSRICFQDLLGPIKSERNSDFLQMVGFPQVPLVKIHTLQAVQESLCGKSIIDRDPPPFIGDFPATFGTRRYILLN